MPSFTNGLLILVEGDISERSKDAKTIWHTAFEWQAREFIKAMEFGTMKSMGIPNPLIYSNTFKNNGFSYRFNIHDDWNPVYIENLTTGKKRRIQYFYIGKNEDDHQNEKSDVCKIIK